MAGNYDSNHVHSDDMDDILRLSREEYHLSQSNSAPVAGPSGSTTVGGHSYLRKQELNQQISAMDAEIQEYDEDIKKLRELRVSRVAERDKLLKELQELRNGAQRKGKGSALQEGINYTLDGFDWSEELKVRMKKIFGINNFRLCQQGVCNANMDGRDIVCVMPTGGGKSLTYQLPALLTPGCTLVVSPLISLITDQILHLRDAGVEAVMLTGGTPKAESTEIRSNLIALASKSGPTKDIKLCYVTPERIAKSKIFMSVLEKLASAGKLARIVIDEAHCVSQLGHDFRPDYGKLSILRQLFPRVPIMALSATCPPKVLRDLITTLRLKAVVDGSCAKTDGTVYFSAPLYRKNLHYSVLPKPSSASGAIQTMTDYILEHHANDTGIVYCLSKKDAENVAKGLNTTSDGIIKTGVYHADVKDHEKERLHKQWRKGTVKVVCATIAFGLGIDKGDVRFVLHHSMSKSLDGFYQESGRAGRDGKDSDCVLYYRPQDATRLSSIICGELDGQIKLHDMVRFAQDMEECRKVHFAKYFSASSHLSVSSWTTNDSDALARCGHCDNCTRPPDSLDHRDVTVEAWQILKIAESMHRSKGRLTLTMMRDLARGTRHGPFEAVNGGENKGKARGGGKIDVDLDAIAGGRVCLNKDDLEMLLVELVVSRYLEESFHTNAYAINVYIIPGPQAARLTRLSRENVSNGGGLRIMCSFKKVTRKGKGNGKEKGIKRSKKNSEGAADGSKGNPKGTLKKRKRADLNPDGEDDGDDEEDESRPSDEDEGGGGNSGHMVGGMASPPYDVSDEDDANDEWAHSFRPSLPRLKKLRRSTGNKGESSRNIILEGDVEVMILSSD